MLHKIDAVVVAVLFLVKLLVFVEVVQINTVQNVVSVAVLFPLILHDYAEVVRTNTAQSVLFVVEPFKRSRKALQSVYEQILNWTQLMQHAHEG